MIFCGGGEFVLVHDDLYLQLCDRWQDGIGSGLLEDGWNIGLDVCRFGFSCNLRDVSDAERINFQSPSSIGSQDPMTVKCLATGDKFFTNKPIGSETNFEPTPLKTGGYIYQEPSESGELPFYLSN